MQQIHINRNRVNSIEFENPEITVPMKPGGECSFELVVNNYGSPTHVHLSASDGLKDNIKFLYDNPYVAHQEWVPVVVKLPSNITRAEGRIKVTTGYGSHSEAFKVFIGERQSESRPRRAIDVDERLGVPQYQQDSSAEHISKETARKSGISEKLIINLLMILLILWILLITFVFKKIDVMYGALAVSILIMILMISAGMNLLTTHEIKKEE